APFDAVCSVEKSRNNVKALREVIYGKSTVGICVSGAGLAEGGHAGGNRRAVSGSDRYVCRGFGCAGLRHVGDGSGRSAGRFESDGKNATDSADSQRGVVASLAG